MNYKELNNSKKCFICNKSNWSTICEYCSNTVCSEHFENIHINDNNPNLYFFKAKICNKCKIKTNECINCKNKTQYKLNEEFLCLSCRYNENKKK